MKKLIAFIGTYVDLRLVAIPLASVLRQRRLDEHYVKVYRDWHVFGIRLLRFQLSLIGKS